MSDNLTEEQKLAYEKIINGENVCIIGKGGSGKSHIISLIMDEETLLLAPTGMAALNLGGGARTIHSTLMIGEKSLNAWSWAKVSSFIESKEGQLRNFFSKYKRIVFDEGSMIISGLFDTFAKIFHTIYGTDSSVLFNGYQIIMMFDPLQLPPVKNSLEPYLDLNRGNQNRKLLKSDYIINNPDFKRLFNKDLDNIVHFTVNMRNTDPEWNEVLDACRTGFYNINRSEKQRLLTILNSRVFHRNQVTHEGSPLKELYDNNTVTSLTRKLIETINKTRLDKLIENNGGLQYCIDRNMGITKQVFSDKYIDRVDNPKKLYEVSVNYMDDLGGYYSKKIYNENTRKYEIITECIITKRQIVMLRCNQLHPNLKNGSLGKIVDILCDDYNNVLSIDVKFNSVDDIIQLKGKILNILIFLIYRYPHSRLSQHQQLQYTNFKDKHGQIHYLSIIIKM